MYACALCGVEGWSREVRPAIVFWPDPVYPGRWYEAVRRCTDRTACDERIRAARVEALRARRRERTVNLIART
jgi:hypothetical protein